MTQKLKLLLRRVENIAEKGENADYQYFLFLPQGFQKAFSASSLKLCDFIEKGEPFSTQS